MRPPSAEDQTSSGSRSIHERSEVGDDYDDEGSVGTAPNGGKYEAGMDWKERIMTLLDRPALADLSDNSEKAHPALTDPYDTYRQILKDAKASAWLLSTLNRTLALRGIDPSAMQATRQTVLETFNSYESRDLGGKSTYIKREKISRHRDPQIYTAHFKMQWDPVAFLNPDYSEGEPRELISRVVTVTGEGDTLQALPCQDYMIQTWPFAAPDFLALIQCLVTESHKPHEGKTVHFEVNFLLTTC